MEEEATAAGACPLARMRDLIDLGGEMRGKGASNVGVECESDWGTVDEGRGVVSIGVPVSGLRDAGTGVAFISRDMSAHRECSIEGGRGVRGDIGVMNGTGIELELEAAGCTGVVCSKVKVGEFADGG